MPVCDTGPPWEGLCPRCMGRQIFFYIAPLILFATLGGTLDGKCIYCSERSTCTPTVTVSCTPLPSSYSFSFVVLVLVVVST
jgi:hypothetical protein